MRLDNWETDHTTWSQQCQGMHVWRGGEAGFLLLKKYFDTIGLFTLDGQPISLPTTILDLSQAELHLLATLSLKNKVEEEFPSLGQIYSLIPHDLAGW